MVEKRIAGNLKRNIESLDIDINDNEIVSIHQREKLIGYVVGRGSLSISYDKNKCELRKERIYIP